MVTSIYSNEIHLLWKYLVNPQNEDAKRKYVYPLFMKVFGEKFLTESAAKNADGYVEGQLLIELKSKKQDWIAGIFQALHYEKLQPKFSAICIITHGFLGLWKLKDLPPEVLRLAKASSPLDAPNFVGERNAKLLKKELPNYQNKLLEKATYKFLATDVSSLFEKSYTIELYAFIQQIKNLDKERIQIRSTNFINFIKRMFKFFEDEIEAIHAFYSLVGFWDITSEMLLPRESEPELVNIKDKYNRQSEFVRVKRVYQNDFRQFVESHYVHYNDGTGFPVDYYFSRFDEVISQLKPEYTKQHGIFFTDYHLCKFTRWFTHNYFETKLHEKYIIFDPAGGSGNLVTSWRGHVHHKIISELQPDLLKTIEKRMLLDDDERGSFTIIPKTREGIGLNFIDKSAEEYLALITQELNQKHIQLDKPFAFFLNPPYKNTDENDEKREDNAANYELHSSILELTGKDAGRERFLAFLGQILNICKLQVNSNDGFEPLVLIFTPTSWLIPRPAFIRFREEFDKYFEYQEGFIVKSKEFFKLDSKWPVTFTIWKFNFDDNRKNKVKLRDYTNLTREYLKAIVFEDSLEKIKTLLSPMIKDANTIIYSYGRPDIRSSLPKLLKGNSLVRQPRYDYSKAKKKDDIEKRNLVSGFPEKDIKNHFKLQRKCGSPNGAFVGFYDDLTPVRVPMDTCNRMTNRPDRVWFRLDTDLKGGNKTRAISGCPDKYGYCAYDLASAKATFSWFTISKSIINNYPLWANQLDLWPPSVPKQLEEDFWSLCFAFVLAENECLVTKFEANNPVEGAPEVLVGNPMCPIDKNAFWCTTLDKEITDNDAKHLVKKITSFYHYWDRHYTRADVLHDQCLKDECYFKYFSYEPYLTAFSGLIQIRKYAGFYHIDDLVNQLREIDDLVKVVKSKFLKLLLNECQYFKQ